MAAFTGLLFTIKNSKFGLFSDERSESASPSPLSFWERGEGVPAARLAGVWGEVEAVPVVRLAGGWGEVEGVAAYFACEIAAQGDTSPSPFMERGWG